MRFRNRGWLDRVPRPKLAKLPKEELQRLHAVPCGEIRRGLDDSQRTH